jgi:hypothetical protein
VLGTGSHRTGDIWSVQLRPVVDQVSADEMSSGKSTDERQLSGHDRSSDDPSELLSVLSRVGRMSAFDSQHLEHSLLRSEHSAATHGSDFDARHGHGHQKVLAVVGSEGMH